MQNENVKLLEQRNLLWSGHIIGWVSFTVNYYLVSTIFIVNINHVKCILKPQCVHLFYAYKTSQLKYEFNIYFVMCIYGKIK